MQTHPIRKPTRLAEFDYTSVGSYFITLVTQNRKHMFGEIVDGVMQIDLAGHIVSNEWMRSTTIRKEITLDEWCVMPNHFHAIVMINTFDRSFDLKPEIHEFGQKSQSKSLGSLVAGFKSVVTKKINQVRQTPGIPIWQRNYYDHIIRSDDDLNRIREYIVNNPLKWELDKEYTIADL